MRRREGEERIEERERGTERRGSSAVFVKREEGREVEEGKSRREETDGGVWVGEGKVRESGKMENSAGTGGEGEGSGKPPNIPFFDSESPLAPVRDLF